MATETPNPYAPSETLTDEAPVEAPAPAAAVDRPSRLGAVVVALLAQPIAGAGFYLLGRRRRFAVWTAAALLTRLLLIVTVWAVLPKLCAIAIVAWFAIALASVVDTAIAKPRGAALGNGVSIGLLFIAVAIGGSLATKQWLIESFRIPAGSMMPNMLVGDHIFVKKGRGDIQRGDVIVFKFPQDRSIDYVKRVVAVSGDTIEVREGDVLINGAPLEHQPIEEPCSYRDESSPIPDEAEPCTLVRETNAGRSYTVMFNTNHPAADHPRHVIPAGEVFVMGDNRDASYDSRRWGTLKVDLIKGTAKLIWWSNDPRSGVRWSRVGRGLE
jgi:signal peptidase I